MPLYDILKFIHIMLAIIAIGFNASYGIWLARAAQSSDEQLGFTLRGIKRLDDWFANPAYLLLGVTGIGMWALMGFRRAFWMEAAVALLLLAIVVGFAVYTPTLRRQIALVEAGQSQTAAYRAVASRGTFVGIALAFVAVTIVGLMVFKPVLAQ